MCQGLRLVALLLIAAVLCACSDEPSEERLRRAEYEEYKEQQAIEEQIENRRLADFERDMIESGWDGPDCRTFPEGQGCSSRGRIVRVVDGDTVETSSGELVRLIGVDAPELYSGRECGAVAARNRVRELLAFDRAHGGTNVHLVSPFVGFPDRDRYGRLLREVVLIGPAAKPKFPGDPDEVNIGARLVSEGLAQYADYADEMGVDPQVYRQHVGVTPDGYALIERERRARRQDLGRWSTCGWR